MTTINAATKAILNGTKSPVPTTADMKGALGALYDVLSECGILDGTAFQANKAVNGYQKLSSGLIIQWGNGVTLSGGALNFGFNIAWPNACLVAYATPVSTATITLSAAVSYTKTLMTVTTSSSNAGLAAAFNWLAIGW
jgi:hypothetical protein